MLKLGATAHIDYTRHESLVVPVLEAAKAGAFDYVFHCAGTSDLWGHTDVILAPGALYATIVGDKRTYWGLRVVSRVINIFASMWRTFAGAIGWQRFRYKLVLVRPSSRWMLAGKRLIEEGKVRVFVDSVYSFDELPEAVGRLKSKKAKGKVVVQIE